ncbi:MAG: hypothetical protein COV74_10570 [Candidatus Omnitrophica bacterium CG11_big_fil_rev_8_21_14_0_20_45_26]|uniref:Uncharacterized protein n=1 Tax=Candidatus Abzuiibacterium crystallinum TaxID=1974748 RepID=A0A2H0LKV0_9BACT|nr:MAG: hypothetical protein COV74_10570 [Candidatus Omnitrophica bacterium CG11_big_fil_rev_8_21_14_0_20_45_26]PIW63890.1 MAG: hypothetical protein COW12_08240 [Candidatus Omnitrophica bacterium CG12_big_fil_rev_8_21_14_0_65_45_16]
MKALRQIKIGEKGLSLMETLFAMAILGIVMAGLASGFNQATKSSQYKTNETSAINDAKRMLEHARYIAEKNGFTGTDSLSDSTYWTNWFSSATGLSALPNVTRSITLPNGTNGDPPYQVNAVINWKERGQDKQYVLSTLISRRGAV